MKLSQEEVNLRVAAAAVILHGLLATVPRNPQGGTLNIDGPSNVKAAFDLADLMFAEAKNRFGVSPK